MDKIEVMPKDVFDTPYKIEYYLKKCHNIGCDNYRDGFCYHGVEFSSYKCTEYTPIKSDTKRKVGL